MKHKFLTSALSMAAALCLVLGLAACGENGGNGGNIEQGEDGHVHSAEYFEVNDEEHWKICTICGEKFSVGKHSYRSDNSCKYCGYNLIYTEGLTYDLDQNTDTYKVTGIGDAKDESKIIIPAYYNGKAVTSIGFSAFMDCSSLTSITIPDSVISIGDQAFHNCRSLESIEIPDGVTSIGERVFYNCSSLTSIEIPDSVTSIGERVFYNCSSLASITIPDSVTSIGREAFFGTAYYNDQSHWDASGVLYIGNHLIYAKHTITGDYTVHANTKTIANYAFEDCNSLESIEIPDGVTSIGREVFWSCESLVSIEIPDSVTSIGGYAFWSCESLVSIEIPDSVTSIGEGAFLYCRGLTGVTIPDSVTSIEYATFWGCSSLESIEIPDGVTSIGKKAFDECSSLASITIPDGVTSIGEYAFYNCSSLASITIPDSVTSIGREAFYGTAYFNDQSHWDASGVLYIGNHLIYAKHTITGDYTVHANTKTIAGAAFVGCSSLTSVTIPDSVISIGSVAFEDCRSLERIVVEENNKTYASQDGILYNIAKTDLIHVPKGIRGTVTIPDGVTWIGDYAFAYCSSLESITIPDSVTSIGDYALYNCDSLTSIQYKGTVQEWNLIQKGEGWNVETGNYTVTCTDGTIDKEGNVTYFEE